LLGWNKSGQQKNQTAGSHLIGTYDDSAVGQDGLAILLSLLLLTVAATVPFWSEDIEPFCMVAQERSQQYKEEEV
jgi:hypothetical protein